MCVRRQRDIGRIVYLLSFVFYLKFVFGQILQNIRQTLPLSMTRLISLFTFKGVS